MKAVDGFSNIYLRWCPSELRQRGVIENVRGLGREFRDKKIREVGILELEHGCGSNTIDPNLFVFLILF